MYQSVMNRQFLAMMPVVCVLSLTLSSCATKSRNEWDNIDYSSVYRKANQRDNDNLYTPSTGCSLDDDFACD